MRIRIRSTETKETVRIEAPDLCSLQDLKNLVASKLSGTTSSDYIFLSLNGNDEIVPSSPNDSIKSLGITSGDLVYYSLRHDAPISGTLIRDDRIPDVVATSENLIREDRVPLVPPISEFLTGDDGAGEEGSKLEEVVDMDVDDEMNFVPPSNETFSVPSFLKRVLRSEKEQSKGKLGLMVVAVHEIFLESGFIVSGEGRTSPDGLASTAAANVSVNYTLPGFDGVASINSTLRFSLMGNHVLIYGFLNGDHPDVHRLCLDAVSSLLSSLTSFWSTMNEADEGKIFEFWKKVKDGLCLPLLIDHCDKNGLPLPPCFALLPTDLKLRVLEFLPGMDIARAACTNKELKFLGSRSNDELWKRKFVEEFGLEASLIREGRWKDRFVETVVRKRNESRVRRRFLVRSHPPRFAPFSLLGRVPAIGGDYDRFPVFGRPSLRLPGDHFPGQRRFSVPHCNLAAREEEDESI